MVFLKIGFFFAMHWQSRFHEIEKTVLNVYFLICKVDLLFFQNLFKKSMKSIQSFGGTVKNVTLGRRPDRNLPLSAFHS